VADRIPAEEKDVVDITDIPDSVELAIGRFLFALMSDVDVRVRWLATHAVRRLANLSEGDVVRSLVDQYERIEERVYRQSDAPFYWLAARLWLLIALDRISAESPRAAAPFANNLLKIAFDDTLPHLLIRAFAKSTLDQLSKSGDISLDSDQLKTLSLVNVSPFRRKKINEGGSRAKRARKKAERKRRYSFDSLDTVPYWYEPALRGFVAVSMEQFLEVAEHWIVKEWQVPENIRYLTPLDAGWHITSPN
jgi:hypothetical protein